MEQESQEQEKDNSITTALGLPKDWSDKWSKRAHNVIINSDTISDTFVKIGKELKEDHFGINVTDEDLSQYEKCLIFVGFIISNTLTSAKAEQVRQTMSSISPFISSLITKSGMPSLEEMIKRLENSQNPESSENNTDED